MDGTFDRDLLERRITQIAGQDLKDAKQYDIANLDISSFSEWSRKAPKFDDPDMVRTALYYLFQPLFDQLVIDPSRSALFPGRKQHMFCSTYMT
jgi:hypothetical protein